VASAVVAALTPVGPALYTAVAAVGSRADYFAEWGSPDWTSWYAAAVGSLFVVTVAAMWKRRRNDWTEILLVGLAAAFAVYSQRTVPVAAAMLAPLVAAPLQDLLGRRPPRVRRERLVVGGGVVTALLVLAVAVPHTSARPLPQAAWVDPALTSLPPGTKVLDDWGLGGYLMWRYPGLDLMMHGYGDTFTTPELRRNTALISVAPGWEEAVRDSGARVAVLRPWSRLGYQLVAQWGWQVVHRSDDLEMLRAPRSWDSHGPAVSPGFGSVG
jgi:hypothetical protein